jgi:hypothetical protein
MRNDDLCELGVVKTATPCSASWDEMQGDDVKRYCAGCRLYVYDFSALTTEEARALLIETEGRLCARIFTRADGTVLTKDCPAGVAKQRRKRVASVAAAAALLGGVSAAVTAAQLQEEQEGCKVQLRTSAGGLAPQPIPSGNEPGTQLMGDVIRPEPVRK